MKRSLCLLLSALLLLLCACGLSSPAVSLETGGDMDVQHIPSQDEPAPSDSPFPSPSANIQGEYLPEDGVYTIKEDISRYLHEYGQLPQNFITKAAARELGWNGGSLEPYAPGLCIGGDPFGNYEGLLPEDAERKYYECDVDTLGADSRGAKRIVYSNDGLIYYTEDHYASFTLLYGNGEGEMENA